MNINSEERKLINELQEKHALNISKAFKIFLGQMKERLEKNVQQ